MHNHVVPSAALFITAVVFIWSGIAPYERSTWYMEVAPVIIAVPLLLLTYKKFRLTDLLYGLIALHAVILMVGGHYTYARVPGFNLEFLTGNDRNSFDGIGHFAQGFIPAMVARELLIRTSSLTRGCWMFILIVFSCLGISALYEIIEWAAAAAMGDGATEFLGTQGDEWDTQKDMALAGMGAIIAQLLLARLHDRLLLKI